MVAGGIEKSCCNYGVRWCKMVEGLPRKCPVSCLRVRQRPMCNQRKCFCPVQAEDNGSAAPSAPDAAQRVHFGLPLALCAVVRRARVVWHFATTLPGQVKCPLKVHQPPPNSRVGPCTRAVRKMKEKKNPTVQQSTNPTNPKCRGPNRSIGQPPNRDVGVTCLNSQLS